MAGFEIERGRGAAPPWREAGAALHVRRHWLALAGGFVMALAGAFVGGQVRLDELQAPALSGPRLRVSPIATFTKASLSREPPPIDCRGC